jgi:gentisate 1,2-dioxygenase
MPCNTSMTQSPATSTHTHQKHDKTEQQKLMPGLDLPLVEKNDSEISESGNLGSRAEGEVPSQQDFHEFLARLLQRHRPICWRIWGVTSAEISFGCQTHQSLKALA